MSGHTAGPWVAHGLTVYGSDESCSIADVEEGPNGDADARLIAAAPRMLTALRNVLNPPKMRDGDGAGYAVDCAIAAVYEATGEMPDEQGVLMKAAPEMLAKLREIDAAHDPYSGMDSELSDALEGLGALLAKIEGGSDG